MSTMTDDIRPVANGSAIWQRMLWKDFRELLPIWITLLAVTAACLWITFALVQEHVYDAWGLVVCAGTFIAIISAATGVFLFATETENRTIQMLRSLPLRPRQMIQAKLLLGLLFVLVSVIVIAALAVWLISQTDGRGVDDRPIFGVRILVWPALIYLLSVIAAMTTASTFYAFVLSGLLVFLATGSLEMVWQVWFDPTHQQNELTWFWLLPLVACFAALGSIVWRANGWVEGKFMNPRWPVAEQSGLAEANSSGSKAASPWSCLSRLLWQSFRQARVSLAICVVALLLVWAGNGVLHFAYHGQFRVKGNGGIDFVLLYLTTIFASTSLTILFGVTVFQLDHQQGRYRFFQQNVERARSFWLARLIPWWTWVGLVVLLLNLPLPGLLESIREDIDWARVSKDFFGFRGSQQALDGILQLASQSVTLPAIVLLGLLGVSQWFSMFVRNPIIAAVLSMVAGGFFLAYAAYVAVLDESLFAYLLPIVLVLYFATWFRSKSWLADSSAWIGWLVPAAAVFLTTSAVLASLVHHRANEFSGFDFDMKNIATALGPTSQYQVDELEFGTDQSRRETAQRYRTAIKLLEENQRQEQTRWLAHLIDRRYKPGLERRYSDPTAGMDLRQTEDQQIDRFVEANQPAIDLILKASEQIGCEPFLDRLDVESRFGQASQLMTAMAAYADKMLRSGEPKPALESIFALDRTVQRTGLPNWGSGWHAGIVERMLLTWADMPDQDATLIRSAIGRLEGAVTGDEPASFAAKVYGFGVTDRVAYHDQLAKDYWNLYRDLKGEQSAFELAHSFREIDHDEFLFDGDIEGQMLLHLPWERERLRRLLKRQAVNEFSWRFQNRLLRNDATPELLLPSNFSTEIIQSANPAERYSIPMADQRLAPYALGHDTFANNYNSRYLLTIEIRQRRYVLVRLALAAYRAEHGKYPETLQPLSAYFTRGVPKTLRHGHDFAWFPNGLPAKSFLGDPQNPRDQIIIEEVNVPLLLPCAVDASAATSKPVPFHRMDDDGNMLEATESGIQLRESDIQNISGLFLGNWTLSK